MCHKHDIKPSYKPVKQKLLHQGKERIEAAKEELEKLLIPPRMKILQLAFQRRPRQKVKWEMKDVR